MMRTFSVTVETHPPGRRVVAIRVGARPILAPGWSGAAHTDIALIDCDVHQTVDKSREVGHNPDAIGKSASHWGALHKEVAFVDLMAQQPVAPPAEPPAA